jgi:hypothetical protein
VAALVRSDGRGCSSSTERERGVEGAEEVVAALVAASAARCPSSPSPMSSTASSSPAREPDTPPSLGRARTETDRS